MLHQVVDNLLTILASGFSIEHPSDKAPLYSLHYNSDYTVNTLIIVGDLQKDFQFPINLIKIVGGIASIGDAYMSGVDQFLIVAPFSESEYMAHAINSDVLLANLPEWIAKYEAAAQRLKYHELWDLFVPIAEIERVAYKSFTGKINV